MLYVITQYYLPLGSGDFSAFTSAEAGTWFSDPRGMQGWVDLLQLKVNTTIGGVVLRWRWHCMYEQWTAVNPSSVFAITWISVSVTANWTSFHRSLIPGRLSPSAALQCAGTGLLLPGVDRQRQQVLLLSNRPRPPDVAQIVSIFHLLTIRLCDIFQRWHDNIVLP